MSENRLAVKLPGLDLKIRLFQRQVALVLDKNTPNTMIWINLAQS